jgi:probable rRNA maturation factor
MMRLKKGGWPGEVSVTNRQSRIPVPTAGVRRAAKKILSALGYESYDLSIVLVEDEEITRLNRRYFRRNRPTNVISFPMAMSGGAPSAVQTRVLGDVVISAETASRQAEEAGRRREEEILFLLIHGILHLVGYDHEGTGEAQGEMEAKEEQLFSSLMPPGRRKQSVF